MDQQRPKRAIDNVNLVTPNAKPSAMRITALVKEHGRVSGYQLSDGQLISREQGVSMAKQGDIAGVAVGTKKGTEFLRGLPDGRESNNLGNLPSVTPPRAEM